MSTKSLVTFTTKDWDLRRKSKSRRKLKSKGCNFRPQSRSIQFFRSLRSPKMRIEFSKVNLSSNFKRNRQNNSHNNSWTKNSMKNFIRTNRNLANKGEKMPQWRYFIRNREGFCRGSKLQGPKRDHGQELDRDLAPGWRALTRILKVAQINPMTAEISRPEMRAEGVCSQLHHRAEMDICRDLWGLRSLCSSSLR